MHYLHTLVAQSCARCYILNAFSVLFGLTLPLMLESGAAECCTLQYWDPFPQIRSRDCLNRSLLVALLSNPLRNSAVNRQNLNPAATAKTAQGTSIQSGCSITPPAAPSSTSWTAGAA